ncbi:MAG: PPC domain-containing DNA-binding protein [Methanomassiliicoccales archaeon]|jgi:predicted DNA-binding protein with PD1-like motif
MRYSEARAGRIFVIRLEQGDDLHECVERFAKKESVQRAYVLALGALDEGSKLVCGPKDGKASPVEPMRTAIDEPRELAGVGTIFPDESGAPSLHMHAATGRNDTSITGCTRAGVKVWKVLEVIVQEIVDNPSIRKRDASSGFDMLEPEP